MRKLRYNSNNIMSAACAVLLLAGAVYAMPPRPKAYPDVTLSSKCAPRYAAVAVTPDYEEIAYLLFDGNLEDGYKRMYVWIPDSSEYGRPKAMPSDPENRYSPFTVERSSIKENEESEIAWSFKWDVLQAGSWERTDYGTGKKIKSSRQAQARFFFNTRYVHGPKTASSIAGNQKLDLSIPGYFQTSGSWSNCPNAIAPWRDLDFYMDTSGRAGEGEDEGNIFFKGRLVYRAHQGYKCSVRSVSDDVKISLVVSPYMEPPIYSNQLTGVEAFGSGVNVPAPYGWYDYDWSMQGGGLKVRTLKHVNRMKSVFEFPKPPR